MSFTVRLPLSVSGFLQFQTQKLGTLTVLEAIFIGFLLVFAKISLILEILFDF